MLRQANGSVPTGPSSLYLRVVRGEVSAKKYVERVKKNVDRQIGKQSGSKRQLDR